MKEYKHIRLYTKHKIMQIFTAWKLAHLYYLYTMYFIINYVCLSFEKQSNSYTIS